MRHNIDFIASLITEDPDVFLEMGGSMSGSMTSSAADMGTSKPPTPGAPGTEDLVDAADPVEDKPLNDVEINKQAQEQSGMPDASEQMADQMKMQQDMQKQQEQQRQQLMQPQMDALQQQMQALNQGVMQGKQATMAGGDQFGALEKEMGAVNALVQNLGKTI
jgi:hypothetical protein